ncbi:unnamed protein product [Brachionus calyciflorus]|uniref:G-protein coupled receptors family 1 profile domain-containing protein n=1 Tax=Brachionus calyciflorus TaxID=104777 RepID=A0A814J9F8_9BILA|nr:unnamed protein product [Brachionus calyciflorus]
MNFIYTKWNKQKLEETLKHQTNHFYDKEQQSNFFENYSSYEPSNYIEQFYIISKWSNVILMTLIALVGLYGNTVSIFIFSSKSYNKNSSKSLRTYLVILSLSDLFVIVLHYIDFTFRSWINLTGSYKSQFNFVDKIQIFCKLVPYLRNVFRTISVYTLLLMTIQRLIVLYFPLARKRWFSVKFNRTLLKWLLILSFVLNLTNIFMNDLIEHESNQELYCSIKKKNIHYQFVADIIFVIVTILIPCLLISLITIILYLKIRHSLGFKSYGDEQINFDTKLKKNYKCTLSHSDTNISYYDSNERALPKKKQVHFNCKSDFSYKKYSTNSIRTTYMLVVLSKWYIMLHLPYFICWCLFYLHLNNRLFNLSDYLSKSKSIDFISNEMDTEQNFTKILNTLKANLKKDLGAYKKVINWTKNIQMRIEKTIKQPEELKEPIET